MEVFLFSFSLLDSVMDGKRSSAREEKRFSVDLLPPTYMHPIFLVSLFSFYRRVRGMIHLVTSLYPNMRHDTCLILRTSNSVCIYIYCEVHFNACNFACFQLSIHGFSFHIISDWKMQCNQTSHPWLLLTPSMFIHRHKPFKTGFDRIYGSYASKNNFI